MKQFSVTINGKKYYFDARTYKTAEKRVAMLAKKICKPKEVK